jgi:hypothetical protein
MILGSSIAGKSDQPPVVHLVDRVHPTSMGDQYLYVEHKCRVTTSRGRTWVGKQSDITCAKCLGISILRDGLIHEDWRT